MDKEYVSTVVIDAETAARSWREVAQELDDSNAAAQGKAKEQETEYSGAHTWVS